MKPVYLKVSVSSVRTNILFDCAIIVKVKLFFVSWKEIPGFTQLVLIAITGLYLYIDHQKVLLILFSRENSLVSLCMMFHDF